jgi:hypothetical protein
VVDAAVSQFGRVGLEVTCGIKHGSEDTSGLAKVTAAADGSAASGVLVLAPALPHALKLNVKRKIAEDHCPIRIHTTPALSAAEERASGFNAEM